MKLKQIIENMDKMPSTLKGFNDTPKLSAEQKKKLMEMVGRYNEFGQKLKMENSLIETATALAEITELAETYACNEGQDWFATEVVKTDFKRARGISETFQKVARECHGKVQQLNALFDDFGSVLSRYYEIADPVQEVLPNPMDMKSQKGLPNANPSVVTPEVPKMMQEVKPNDKNLKSQHCLPSGGPAKAQVKEISVNTTNIKSQRGLPAGGPAPSQIKENETAEKFCVKCGKSSGSNNYCSSCLEKNKKLRINKSATNDFMRLAGPGAKIKEVTHNDKNVKSQRDLPSGGPATPQVKESSPPGFDKKHPDIVKKLSKQYGDKDSAKYATMWKIHKNVDEINHNEANLQSQRELPQGGPENYMSPTLENPKVSVNPAGDGEMNIKGEREDPQGGPAPKQIKEVDYNFNDLQSQRRLPSLGDIMKMK